MKFFGRNLEGYAKWVAILASALLVASGLCGAQFAILSGMGGNAPQLEGLFTLTGLVELVVMMVSALGLILVLILWPIEVIRNNARSNAEQSPDPDHEQ